MAAKQLDFLALDQQSNQQALSRNPEVFAGINGLRHVQNYITEDQHDWLLNQIDNVHQHHWLDDLKRRVQHYGFKYDYRARRVNLDMRIGELPKWLKRLSCKLHEDGHIPEIADQVIINEYLPGQGISSHIDCEPCFEETIASLSLGSGCVMNFTHKSDRARKIPVWLEPKSLIVLTGEARYDWLHGIPARKSDEWEGNHKRKRRVSLTFRKVILKTEAKKHQTDKKRHDRETAPF